MSRIISIKAKSPNILFEQWLTEWINKESDKGRITCYEAALKALQKFPLPLATGRECMILQGFGEKLCKRLDDKLLEHQSTSGISPPPLILINRKLVSETPMNNVIKRKSPEINASKPVKTYCPAYRSGAYAILCALYKYHMENKDTSQNCAMQKKELITSAQRFCDKSFTKCDQGATIQVYTAWSSMRTLIAKQLVVKEGNPVWFQLTDLGMQVAKPLYEDALNDPENANFIHHIDNLNIQDKQPVRSSSQPKTKGSKRKIDKNPIPSSLQSNQNSQCAEEHETFLLTPGSFKVFLLVDTQETSGSTKKDVYDEIIMELNAMCVNYEIRHLNIGDYTWICRHDETHQELVLPYIVERKRMDDFGASIKDGRFHEQKFRLKQSGIANLIYLVESHRNNLHCGMPLSSILQAASNTLLQDGFSLKFTDNVRQTAEYLSITTRIIAKLFLKKTLMKCSKDDLGKCDIGEDLLGLMTFQEFNLNSSKNKAMNVSEMFAKQLLQLHGLSVDKALAIVSKYPTPRLLMIAYDACQNEKEAENLLANIEFGTQKKKVGPVISTTIYQLYNFTTY